MPNDDDDMSAIADMSAAHAVDRAMPSFCMRAWSVVRLRPRRMAAPRGPPSTQLLSCSARRIASRSVASSVVAPVDGATAELRREHAKGGPVCQGDGALDRILELPHVSRPS